MILLVLLLTQPAPEITPKPDTTLADIVYYGARKALFIPREERVVLLDSAWIRYRDMVVYADSITYDIKRRIISAYTRTPPELGYGIVFRTASEAVDGTELHYNVDTRRGMMRNARSKVENGFIYAKEAWLVREKLLHAREAHYTTCDLPHPHYTFLGSRVKLYMDDIAIIQPVILRIGKLPVLGAPFWLVPVASKRKSGLMPFKVGNAKDQGYYAKGISYYWVINDYADITFMADIMTRKGIQLRAEAVYIVEPFSRGSIQGAFIREFWSPDNPNLRRYSFNMTSASRLTPRTDLAIQTELISDTAYAPEYAEDRLDWLKQEVYSYAALTHRFPNFGRINLRAERRTYYMRHYDYFLFPYANIGLGTRPLLSGWNFNSAFSFYRRQEKADSAGVDTLTGIKLVPAANFTLTSPELPIGVLDISDQISLLDHRITRLSEIKPRQRSLTNQLTLNNNQKIIGTFNTSQGLTISHLDILTDTSLPAPRYSFHLNTSFSLFRVFSSLNSPYLTALLHTINPNLQFNYTPRVTPTGLFGRINITPPEVAQLHLNINNGFQVKTVNQQKFDLGTVNIRTGYDLVASRLSPISATITTRPLTFLQFTDTVNTGNRFDLYLDGNASFLPESLRFGREYVLLTTFSWNYNRADSLNQTEKGWELRLNHSLGNQLNMLTGSIVFRYKGWQIGINSLGYNFIRKQLTDYSINIWRDLHCWEAIGTVSGLGEKWRYDFEVRIKKLPDVRFGKSTFQVFLP